MTRWIAAGALGAVVAAGGLNGVHRAQQERAAAEPVPPAASLDLGQDQPPPAAVGAPGLAADDPWAMPATHEAGHAAAARELGIPVEHIDLYPDGSGTTTYPDHYYRDPGRDAYNNAVIDVAGQESAAAWYEQRYGYTHQQALAETAASARSDLAQLRVDAARAGIGEQQARQRAQDIVHEQRAEIDRIAQRLVDRGGYLNEWELER